MYLRWHDRLVTRLSDYFNFGDILGDGSFANDELCQLSFERRLDPLDNYLLGGSCAVDLRGL